MGWLLGAGGRVAAVVTRGVSEGFGRRAGVVWCGRRRAEREQATEGKADQDQCKSDGQALIWAESMGFGDDEDAPGKMTEIGRAHV